MIIGLVDGVINGGWNYVWAAYGLTWLGLFLYVVSLFMRLNTEKQIDGTEREE